MNKTDKLVQKAFQNSLKNGSKIIIEDKPKEKQCRCHCHQNYAYKAALHEASKKYLGTCSHCLPQSLKIDEQIGEIISHDLLCLSRHKKKCNCGFNKRTGKIKSLIKKIIGEHELTPKEMGEAYPSRKNDYFDGRNDLRAEQRFRAKSLGIDITE